LIDKKTVTAIILVAGNSTRFGKDRNKNFEIINGKSVLSYSLDAFDKNEYIDNIIVAAKECEKSKVNSIIDKEALTKNIKIIIGGNTRKQSVYNCIKMINSDIVIIHDGARPLIKQEYIINCIENMKKFKGTTIGVKSKDTIKITDENNIVINTTNRNNTWLIQTPQCFDRLTLLKMHNKYKNEAATDDCTLLEKGKYKIKIIQGDYSNIKITTSEDLDIIKKLLKKYKTYN
jgi:2-C-methyl-D-erythritol 4-phosphate cytidylyltransferase